MELLAQYKEEEQEAVEKQSKHPKSAKSSARGRKLSKGKHMQNVPMKHK